MNEQAQVAACNEAENNLLQEVQIPAEKTENRGPKTPVDLRDSITESATEQQAQVLYPDVKWPEDMLTEPEQVNAFKTLAGELKLSSEQVQQLVDFERKAAQHNAAVMAEEKREIISRWAQETKKMYGAKLEEEISFALRAANTFGGPDLRALLEDTGLGNHPVIIRTLSGIGRSISEDACPGGQPSAPQDKTFAEALYGKR